MDRPSIIIKAIAIDDEPIALDIIRRHAEVIPGLKLSRTFSGCAEALTYLREERPDLIFLDITMPDMNGLEFARQIDPDICIIFTTAYAEYAVTGFDMAATDYLLKPISFSRFAVAVERTRNRIREHNQPSVLFVKDGYSLVPVNLKELLFIESDGNYITFFETAKKTVSRMKLTEALEKLPAPQFIRIHQCFAVNRERIGRIEGYSVTIGEKKLPVSARYRKDLLKKTSS